MRCRNIANCARRAPAMVVCAAAAARACPGSPRRVRCVRCPPRIAPSAAPVSTIRKFNVIVTSLPESSDDSHEFVTRCEQNLNVKPALGHGLTELLRTVTSGSNRPRRLQVHLKFEPTASDVVQNAKLLHNFCDKCELVITIFNYHPPLGIDN